MTRGHTFRPAAALTARIALGAFGIWVASIGVRALWPGQPFAASPSFGRWLIGGVIVHDGIIAPAVFVLGAIAVKVTSARVRQALAAILLIGGSALIVGLPNALRKGQNPNPTVTPLDYTRNLIIVILAVIGGVALVMFASAYWRKRMRRDKLAAVAAVAEVTAVPAVAAVPELKSEPDAELESESELMPSPESELAAEAAPEQRADVASELEPAPETGLESTPEPSQQADDSTPNELGAEASDSD